ncbi:chromosome segregation protein SMC [Reichenbachiella agarivorans]|uniref:Chromosome segregation protein SMC n=1 Tax=Reichenbachiella agarivorans TaxID=2979464 RepID=A0ABY6CMV2_9BACT|nr:chromosome segregation protein SMC [Reichenbachiella agarivorans]UXP31714.1 chromosome segregation protein SMC [Reichenbachiella agarivorans]
MEINQKQQPKKQEAQSRKRVFIILVALVILALSVGFVYQLLQSLDLEEKNESTQQQLDAAYYELDSMSNELDTRILKIAQLGGEIDTLLQIKNQLEEEKKAFRKKAYGQINDLQEKVKGYKELLVNQDKEIERLKKMNAALLEENTELKDEANVLNESIKDLNTSRTELEKKVAVASQLKIDGMKILAVSSNGKEKDGEFKNRHIDHLKIQFDVLENHVAPIEGKNILVKITGPDSKVVFDVATGSGTFVFEGRESFYTVKKEILYDRNTQSLTFLYDKGSEYDLGKYTVEVYTDSYKMGQGSFVVK